MQYKTKVPEIHCSGCVNLIKMTLEDEFKNVQVDQDTKIVTFESDENSESAVSKLNDLFRDLKDHGYTYIEFSQINADETK